jgi:hypothetical protein
MGNHVRVCLVALLVLASFAFGEEKKRPSSFKEWLELIIQETQPLKFPRGDRLPLYVWAAIMEGIQDEAEMTRLLQALDERGIAALVRWSGGKAMQQSIDYAVQVGKVQKKLNLPVNVDATGVVYGFCDGTPETGHTAEDGTKFHDTSFTSSKKMGCPFALKDRYEPMRQQIEPFLKAYKENEVPLGFWAVDWEIDGPIEWNEGWQHSKRCVRCREKIKKIDDFTEFQKALRRIRSDIQNEVFCKTIKQYFPKALIGNYGVNPHDGYRYWHDWFEKDVEEAPAIRDQKAVYRQWVHEFSDCGYTFAMPVLYTWYPIFGYYDFKNTDYRWFYNMLLEATSVGKHTPVQTPIIPFVHWSTTDPPKELPKDFAAMSETAYQELLWHILLRGHDTFCLWCPRPELPQELRPLHAVYAESLEYKEFLDKGEPVLFDVPKQPGTVVSALMLGNRLLVRRTDFADAPQEVRVQMAGKEVAIPKSDGKCQLIELK